MPFCLVPDQEVAFEVFIDHFECHDTITNLASQGRKMPNGMTMGTRQNLFKTSDGYALALENVNENYPGV